jgi:hypothetical protein
LLSEQNAAFHTEAATSSYPRKRLYHIPVIPAESTANERNCPKRCDMRMAFPACFAMNRLASRRRPAIATLRNVVDLDQLREQLVAVVQETMQPSSVSLWLIKSERGANRAAWGVHPLSAHAEKLEVTQR